MYKITRANFARISLVTKKKKISVRVFEQKQRFVWDFHDDV